MSCVMSVHSSLTLNDLGFVSRPGMADDVDVDLATINVPSSNGLGCGKQRCVSNKKYGDFIGH